MRTTITSTLMVLVIAVLASCNATHKHEHHHTQDNGISLNEGQKWNVNAEMKPFLKRGAQLLHEYSLDESGDYRILALNLKEQNDSLIRNCTMTGESHEELHKWLHPHLELVKELESTKSEEDADQIIARLEESYITYQTFFE